MFRTVYLPDMTGDIRCFFVAVFVDCKSLLEPPSSKNADSRLFFLANKLRYNCPLVPLLDKAQLGRGAKLSYCVEDQQPARKFELE